MKTGLVLLALVGVWSCSSDKNSPGAPLTEVPLPAVWGGPVLVDYNPDPHIVEVDLTAGAISHTLADGVTLDMWAYNGSTPGPLLHARVGDRIIVHFTNHLREPTTVHWHGLRIPAAMDGSPRIQEPVPPGETFVYDFVAPEAGSFWYHPHVHANAQVERGLYGPIIIRRDVEPEYAEERIVILDDMLLSDSDTIAPFLDTHMEEMHGRYGNFLVTNGVDATTLTTAGREGDIERWRLLNSANARTMELSLEGATARVIGTDGGLLSEPYAMDHLTISPGQRFDLEVTFGSAGHVALQSHIPQQDSSGVWSDAVFSVFAVDVAATGIAPTPVEWPSIPAFPVRAAVDAVTLEFSAETIDNMVHWHINGMDHQMGPLFSFAQGSAVHMTLTNLMAPEHPFHLHGQFFHIVDPPQVGLYDTALVPGSSTVKILAYFDNPGMWMAHCHILEHAELGMMSEIEVVGDDAVMPIGAVGHEHRGE